MILQGLYGITDNTLLADGLLLPYVEAALSAGMRLLQYRDKTQDTQKRYKEASALKELCDKYQAILIINDDVALAKQLNVGVHLGQQDGSIKDARKLLGNTAIIGATCHSSFELAKQAKMEGASYLAFGRFFPSQTKPEAEAASLDILLEAKTLDLPICAIGGITPENAPILIGQGIDLLAVINALFAVGSPHAVEKNTKDFITLFPY